MTDGPVVTVAPVTEVSTPVGTARVHGTVDHACVGLLVLGHGAGGGVGAPDLVAVAAAAQALGWAAVRVEQPYRVLSARRPPPAAATLDTAWAAVLESLRWSGPLVVGGRSSGARVAARSACGDGVVALAFPLRPPGKDRTAELLAVDAPLLVVQGERDAFGGPEQVRAAAPAARVHAVPGADHSFAARRLDGRSQGDCVAEVAGAVGEFLDDLLSGPARPSTPT